MCSHLRFWLSHYKYTVEWTTKLGKLPLSPMFYYISFDNKLIIVKLNWRQMIANALRKNNNRCSTQMTFRACTGILKNKHKERNSWEQTNDGLFRPSWVLCWSFWEEYKRNGIWKRIWISVNGPIKYIWAFQTVY